MYKDKDKQREANRKAQAKFKAKGITESITNQGITSRVLPSCKYCGKQLDHAVLECCYDCASKQPTKVSPSREGHTLSSKPALEYTGKLTAFERKHYKPASELPKGQHNSVSKPGDDHYI